MKLFLREHMPLVILHIVQLFLVLLIYWLDGYRNMLTALYSVFLGLVMLSGYLIYRYVSHRSLYSKLSDPMETLDDSIHGGGYTPLSSAFDQLLQTQYRHYQQQLKIREKTRNDHLAFMNQWVHQMKTPLSIIRLMMEEADDARSASILEESDRMEKGLDTVLYAARLETFERDFQVEAVTLRAVVENVIRENKRLFIGNKVYPDLQVDSGLIVESDAKWLSFMIGQLVTNAIKYSAESHQKVTFTSYVRGKNAILEILDRGIGISLSDRKRVFEPFYTGDNGRRYRESTGMGLYFAQEISNRLGHKIELESEVGVGTSVKLIFTSYLTKT
ncbi:sensor histidine kinase [Paenibacillus baekrokdamisoli]|uniref:histidine kinase n=1 Tax=Paenibacillus baekrokdamisoli TaxID=1712516 RepID=A0A3G9J8J7_9BACL|nr:sensor histidine kinase [Paenibacillus baekrokdamisoli]MBB3072768.1 signal transduction histidine kinase [Paenibacillus baekrokdamisoli]BBH20158.1 sensor histidine kinase [Paenibacillus baekrokdamisoli]